jgi:hypothetical protein
MTLLAREHPAAGVAEHAPRDRQIVLDARHRQIEHPAGLVPRRREDLRFAATMLSIPCDQRDRAMAMTPEKFKDETLRTLVDTTEATAGRHPTCASEGSYTKYTVLPSARASREFRECRKHLLMPISRSPAPLAG